MRRHKFRPMVISHIERVLATGCAADLVWLRGCPGRVRRLAGWGRSRMLGLGTTGVRKIVAGASLVGREPITRISR